MSDTATLEYTKKDFVSDQQVKWCPGCGDYAILSAVQSTLPKLGIKKENIAFVAGIGCSSRFPYYMNTYGFHTIHGRAPAIATGLKLANPDLSVWMATGDGDALSIGGNHFIHMLRRNIDINVLLFNNEIYGLTKGQYSPTSQKGIVTKSSPQGSIETPFVPGEIAIGARATFFARIPDSSPKTMSDVFYKAANHKGTSLVEILQNCVIFNDKTFEHLTEKSKRADAQLILEHGQPMIFGADSNKGLVLDGLKLKVVTIGEDGITEEDILVHDAHEEDPTLHGMLARMTSNDGFPVAVGVIRETKSSTFNDRIIDQVKEVERLSNFKNVDDLLSSGDTWVVS